MRAWIAGSAALALVATSTGPEAQLVDLLIEQSGDGTNTLDGPMDVAFDSLGNTYVSGIFSDNVFRIGPGGNIEQIIDASGDGQGNALSRPRSLAVDSQDILYVASESNSANIFKVEPSGNISLFFAGHLHGLTHASDILLDTNGNLFVIGRTSNNVFKVAPDASFLEILDAQGDGANAFVDPRLAALDPAGNLFVATMTGNNAFRVTEAGVITQWVSPSDLGGMIYGVAADGLGNTYFSPYFGSEVLRVDALGQKEIVLDQSVQFPLGWITGIDADSNGTLYSSGLQGKNILRTRDSGVVTQIMDNTGNGLVPPDQPWTVRVHPSTGEVFLCDTGLDVVFRVEGCGFSPASVTPRLGSGSNPNAFVEQSLPVTGAEWQTTVDVSQGGGSLSTILLGGSSTQLGTAFGELLVLPPFLVLDVGSETHNLLIPEDCSLVGRTLVAQGAIVQGAPLAIQLTNALDLVIGTH